MEGIEAAAAQARYRLRRGPRGGRQPGRRRARLRQRRRDRRHHGRGGREIEILTLAGELRPDETGHPRAFLQGTISDTDAKVYGGIFLPGGNPICITLELVLQEWIPEAT